jgi:hypothetical protein
MFADPEFQAGSIGANLFRDAILGEYTTITGQHIGPLWTSEVVDAGRDGGKGVPK